MIPAILTDATTKLQKLLAVAPAYGEITFKVIFHDGQARTVETSLVERSKIEAVHG